jgi:EAL domain-containing protein (putative c-di-GMP-specific phosphodiesterase class I)
MEFRLSLFRPKEPEKGTRTQPLTALNLSRHLVGGGRSLRKMLAESAVLPLFQPILNLRTGETEGYELLSRGHLDGVETSPIELFSLAEELGLEVELCDVFRARGLEEAQRLEPSTKLFINTHPSELLQPAKLTDSLQRLRRGLSTVQLVLEIHERATAEAEVMRRLRRDLKKLGVRLAYDDFGAGQSRLREIGEAPPDYLKFDMGLVRNLDRGPRRRRELLQGLVSTAQSLGITPIAEGVETAEEDAACREVGFGYAQGFYFGYPLPLAATSTA